MNLIDRIALHKTVSMLLDFILAILKLFMQPNKDSGGSKWLNLRRKKKQ